VFDHTRAMTLALIALGYSKPFEAQIEKISRAVLRTAENLSKRLGSLSIRTLGGATGKPIENLHTQSRILTHPSR
jgi:hypothetical protein